jgi:hypothetical protein
LKLCDKSRFESDTGRPFSIDMTVLRVWLGILENVSADQVSFLRSTYEALKTQQKPRSSPEFKIQTQQMLVPASWLSRVHATMKDNCELIPTVVFI